MKKANDDFGHYVCTSKYYRYFGNILLTDGAKALAEKYECFWFLDIITSYQTPELKLKTNGFQVWTLKKRGEGFIVTCDDGNGNICITQTGGYTSFSADHAEIWVEPHMQYQVALLPSEH